MSDIHLDRQPPPVKPVNGMANAGLQYARPASRSDEPIRESFEVPRTSQPTAQAVQKVQEPFTKSQLAPAPIRTVALLEMIQRTNEYLANSAPEFKLCRLDRCQELEYYLIRTHNFSGFDFIEPTVKDPSRRRYLIPHRLMVAVAG